MKLFSIDTGIYLYQRAFHNSYPYGCFTKQQEGGRRMDDMETMERLRKKEQKALEEIIKEYNPYVSAIVYKILCGYAAEIDIQGVINDVFFRLWENADKFDARKYTDLKPYLGAIARNTAINEKNKIVQNLPLDEHILGEMNDSFSEIEKKQILQSAMAQLSKKDQVILLKFYFQGKKIKEIAKEENMPLSTVKINLKRSRSKLKKILEEEGFIYED